MWTHDREKAKNFDPKKHRRDVLFYDTKFDGIRMTFFKQEDNTLLAFGSKIEDHLEMMEELSAPEGRDWLWAIRDNLPPMSSIDGELVFGRTCTDVIRGVKDKNPHVGFTPFAVPYFENKWLGHQPVEYADYILKKIGLYPPPRNKICQEISADELMTILQKKRELLQCEGLVLKGGHYHSWYKYKKTNTVDAVVMEWKAGTGKHTGRMGALIIGVYDNGELVNISNVGTGYSDDDRIEITREAIGKVVEVEYQAVATKGRLQHPRFIRFREDKFPHECTIDQLDMSQVTVEE